LASLGVQYLITVPWALDGVVSDDVERKCDAIRCFAEEVIAPLDALA